MANRNSTAAPLPGDRSPEPPRLPWRLLVATAAAGALLLAVAVGLAGSPVAVAGALLVAAILALIAAFAGRRRRGWGPGGTRLPPLAGGAAAPAAQREAGADTGLVPGAAGEAGVVAVAQALAEHAVRELRAPAASVLVPRGRRLVAAGTAGDWALARRLQSESAGEPAAQGPFILPGAPADDPQPPDFPLDDLLPRLLALYPRALPLERWQELADVPPALLPVAALADRGVGVAVPLRHRGRLAGLWVLARRPGSRPYADAELRTLERMARDAAPALAGALAKDAE